jgi:hypothetical protein
MEIDIKGIDKAELLAALYNGAKPLGMAYLAYDPTPMTKEEAQKIIDGQPVNFHYPGGGLRFDYLKGRVMKVNLREDEFDPWGYDRDNGDGSAENVVSKLKRAEK